MRNVHWMNAGLFVGLLSAAGPSFADDTLPWTTQTSPAALADRDFLVSPVTALEQAKVSASQASNVPPKKRDYRTAIASVLRRRFAGWPIFPPRRTGSK